MWGGSIKIGARHFWDRSMFVLVISNIHISFQKLLTLPLNNVPVWLSGRALRQQRKRLWVRFPGNTHTDENV